MEIAPLGLVLFDIINRIAFDMLDFKPVFVGFFGSTIYSYPFPNRLSSTRIDVAVY
jgi:hypothetical protein